MSLSVQPLHEVLPESEPDAETFQHLDTPERLLAIQETELLAVPPQLVFRLLTELASHRVGTPVSLITFVTDERQHFVGSYGLSDPYRADGGTPLSHSFCQHVTTRNMPLVIHDSRNHPLVCDNLAIRDLQVGSYLGIPVVDDNDNVLGSFCTIDEKPRQWTRHDLQVLQSLVDDVMSGIRQQKAEVSERKRQETQLRQSQKMEAIGTLAGSIAHNFNNILMSVRTYTELINRNVTKHDAVLKYVKELHEITTQAKGIVKQLVSWNRPSDDDSETISLNGEILVAIPIIRALMPSSVDIETVLPEYECVIKAAKANVSQIILNLVANAEYAMREHGGRLTIELATRRIMSGHNQSDFVSLSITDTGCGIPDDILDQVCDPFFTTKLDGDGNGIGLSVVYRIVQSLNGTMEVRSTAGVGTSIQMLFPQTVDSDADETGKAETDHALEFRSVAAETTLLLVDDEPAIVKGLADLLDQIGYQVTRTSSSREALSLFQRDPDRFDLLITDQTMPELTGDKLIQAIHQVRADLPTILLSGFSHTVSRDVAELNGVSAFCEKPVSIVKLSHAIEKALGGTSVAKKHSTPDLRPQGNPSTGQHFVPAQD